MSRTRTSHGRTGRPPVTSRAQILTAAREIIDRDGWEKLTIRRLAAEIGIGPTTLYHHVRDKKELLLLLLNDYLGQVEHPPLPDDPRDRIIVATTAMHDAGAAWPWVVETATTDGFVALLDESALWMVEVILAAAEDYGCTPAQAVYIFRCIWYYTAGEIIVRANTASRRAGDLGPFSLSDLDASQVPHLAAIGDSWGDVAQADTYVDGLCALVDGLLAQATSAKP
ncbi:TetR/AcrR family transcriptional regulator [Actinomadura fulvescens]|uniref:TetR/AcrR family transcriptional regulator n=1 Tax=Actinomadura fulvescens TaxID=46160 RepID=A0ABP6DED8_9ACTN